MTDVSSLFAYLSLGLIILWTARLARSKGRNPFLWGGIALLLMLIPSWPDLLGMGPMMVLLFLKSPQPASQETVPETVTCPKCHAYHAAGHTYCVNCGWELGRSFPGNPRQRSEAMPAAAQVEPEPAPIPEQIATTDDPPARRRASDVASPVFEPPGPPADSPPSAATFTEPAGESDATAIGAPPQPEPEPEVNKPAEVRYPITPAGFTQRGWALLAEGQVQSAIDQFTKAIALDPGYLPAWEGRAEAYARMGRTSKAEEDRLHLENLRDHAPQ